MLNIEKNAPIFSVSQYVSFINDLVTVVPVLVEGEVSNFRDIPGRNFCYFDIKDESVAVKCFQGFWQSKKTKLENGSSVRVYGYPTLQKNGSLVIDVKEVFLIGDGELQKAYQKLKNDLEKEGLFDLAFKKEVPQFPGSIGLIAGKNSSAYHDVTAELQERWGGVDVFFCASKVQGVNAKREIIDAIRYFNRIKNVDVLILARGGGSMEDLQAFDSEEVVREVFASKIPIISAIGHEDHWTLVDFVSDVRAKTPTKAAQIAVFSRVEMIERMDFLSTRARGLVKSQLGESIMRLQIFNDKVVGNFKDKIKGLHQELQVKKEMAKNNVDNLLGEKRTELDNFARILEVLNPENIMSRGYAMLQKDGKRIRDISEVSRGDFIDVRLQNGEISSKIQEVKEF